MRAYSVTNVGKSRTVNQDYVLCEVCAVGCLPNLFLVADGMGGHNGGDFASRFCVNTVRAFVEEQKDAQVVSVLREAIGKANHDLLEEASQQPDLIGMGTTMVAATIDGNDLYVANVGDSRLYIQRGNELEQITEDHSLVEVMIRNGELKREEARFHPQKNVITRALGGSAEVDVDFFEVDLSDADRILMCSDGLSNMIDDKEIADIMSCHAGHVEDMVRELVDRANEYGGKDNITALVIEL